MRTIPRRTWSPRPGPTAALRAQVYEGFNSWELFGQIDALAADIVASIRLVTVSNRMSSS